MDTSLTDLLQSLANRIEQLDRSEEATKQGAILPILSRLGWDVTDTEQVRPEFRVGDGADHIDYCLSTNGRHRVFVEAKRAEDGLTSRENQLLRYAFEHGVELAALTTGLLWWLYLPLKPGVWKERRFAVIDIRRTDEAAGGLSMFLSQQSVDTGSAVEHARTAVIEGVLPSAWKDVCDEHLTSLAGWLQKRAGELSGFQASRQQVEAYLTALHTSKVADISSDYRLGAERRAILSEPATQLGTGAEGPAARVSAEAKAQRAEEILAAKNDWYPLVRLREEMGTGVLRYVLQQRPRTFELKRDGKRWLVRLRRKGVGTA